MYYIQGDPEVSTKTLEIGSTGQSLNKIVTKFSLLARNRPFCICFIKMLEPCMIVAGNEDKLPGCVWSLQIKVVISQQFLFRLL